jgi:hypothetical protein
MDASIRLILFMERSGVSADEPLDFVAMTAARYDVVESVKYHMLLPDIFKMGLGRLR